MFVKYVDFFSGMSYTPHNGDFSEKKNENPTSGEVCSYGKTLLYPRLLSSSSILEEVKKRVEVTKILYLLVEKIPTPYKKSRARTGNPVRSRIVQGSRVKVEESNLTTSRWILVSWSVSIDNIWV